MEENGKMAVKDKSTYCLTQNKSENSEVRPTSKQTSPSIDSNAMPAYRQERSRKSVENHTALFALVGGLTLSWALLLTHGYRNFKKQWKHIFRI